MSYWKSMVISVEKLRKTIEVELENKKFAFTQKFYKSDLSVLKDKNIIKIANIVELNKESVYVFVSIREKNFYIIFEFDPENFTEIVSIDYYPGINIFYNIISVELSTYDLCEMTCLSPHEKINIGDVIIKKKGIKSNYNSIIFKFKGPNFFNLMINEFLFFLEKDAENIKNMALITKCDNLFIDVCFNSEFPLTELNFERKNIESLNKLGLCTTFDIYGE